MISKNEHHHVRATQERERAAKIDDVAVRSVHLELARLHAKAVERYIAEGRKFSLIDSGIVGTPTCKLLAINGMEDSIFPIEDSLIVATQGDKKDIMARGDRGHMGNPGAEDLLYPWIDAAVAGKP